MIRLISIYGLIFLILWPSWRMVLVISWYQIHRDYISQELCVNRNRPELQCNGKCILALRMKAAQRQGQADYLDGLVDLLAKELVFIPTLINAPEARADRPAVVQENFHFFQPESQKFSFALLRPPIVRAV